jgi:hypothetical protein
MPRRRWNFSVLQLLLLTALCGLCAGVVAMSRQAAGRSPLQNLRFSPDGRWLAACYYNEEVRVWDLDRGRLHARLRVPADDSGYVALSGARFVDQDTLVALRVMGDMERRAELVLWDVRRNRERRTIPVSTEWDNFAVSPDGNLLALNAVTDFLKESRQGRSSFGTSRRVSPVPSYKPILTRRT